MGGGSHCSEGLEEEGHGDGDGDGDGCEQSALGIGRH